MPPAEPSPDRPARPPSASESDADRRDHFVEVEVLFRRAASAAPADRPRIVAGAPVSEAVRDEVLELLDEDARTASPLDGSPKDEVIARALVDPVAAGDGTAVRTLDIPGFTLGPEIGRGGMGVVHRAEQHAPERAVAIKLLAGAVPSPAAMARFRREARALARLDHPMITGIHGAGTVSSPAGPVPWFAMDLINGHPLEPGGTTSARLSQLADVADAVQHAHSRGVIHRDLKPGNILVDERGDPRIVDFGVARLTGESADDPTALTQRGQLLGTPAYMAPEQALGDPEAVDARTDVYALGAVAYEVLSGVQPFDVGSQSFEDQLRTVRELDPRPLSAIAPKLPRDLALVVARAMDKDPARRYPTAAAFADDLRCVRDGRPVTARPASAIYQLRRLAGRHRTATAAIAASLVLLVGALAVIAVLLQRSIVAEADARLQQARAEAEARASDAVRDFLIRDVLFETGPSAIGEDHQIIDELLDRAESRLASRFDGQPDIAAPIYAALFTIRAQRNEPQIALPLGDRALELFAEARAGDASAALSPSAEELAWRVQLRRAFMLTETGDTEEAWRTIDAVLADAIDRYGPDSRPAIEAAVDRGMIELQIGDRTEAFTQLRRELERAERVLGPSDSITRQAVRNLGQALLNHGSFAEAQPLLERTVADRIERLGPNAWTTIMALTSLSQNQTLLGDHDAAIETIDRVEAGLTARGTSPSNPVALRAVTSRGMIELRRGQPDAAVAALERARDVGLASETGATLTMQPIHHNLAAAYLEAGRPADAQREARAALAVAERLLPPNSQYRLASQVRLGQMEVANGNNAAALERLADAWSAARDLLGPDHPLTRGAADRAAAAADALDDPATAAIWRGRAEENGNP